MEMEEVTDWIKVRLPAKVRAFCFQVDNLLSIFSIMYLCLDLVTLPWMIGAPRYIPKSSVRGIPLRLLRLIATPLGTPGEVKSLFFLRFMARPETLAKWSRHSIISFNWWDVASPKSIKSSAKNKWVSENPPLEILSGFQRPSLTLSWIKCANFFMTRIKRYGESGSPCCSPLPGEKGGRASSFHKTERLQDETQKRIK